jgi:hypothetical protein
MGRTCIRHGKMRDPYNNLIKKPQGKRHYGRTGVGSIIIL